MNKVEAAAMMARMNVEQLGSRIGYGRMMQLAEICWREHLEERGYPTGGEFTSGVCRKMLDNRGFKSNLEMMDAYDELLAKCTPSEGVDGLSTDHLRLMWVDPEVLHQAEEAECANAVLNDLCVPRVDTEEKQTYSLVGRIKWAIENLQGRK